MASNSCCEEAGDLTVREPEEMRILKALKEVMKPDDEIAKELYDWLKSEIEEWKQLAASGADEVELSIFAEVHMFNIIDEINNRYLWTAPNCQSLRGSC